MYFSEAHMVVRQFLALHEPQNKVKKGPNFLRMERRLESGLPSCISIRIAVNLFFV